MIEFQSAHPVRGATFFGFRILPAPLFQSTRPVRGATRIDIFPNAYKQFQSTHPVRGATLTRKNRWCTWTISIHAPRAGCDAGRRGHLTSRASISIHAPRARCDNVRSVQGGWLPVFQSTHPVRGATLRGSVSSPARSGFQSTHPVRGATMDKAAAAGNNEFQSTRPVWGATSIRIAVLLRSAISIHAPRVGRDWMRYGFAPEPALFQSTRPVWDATMVAV